MYLNRISILSAIILTALTAHTAMAQRIIDEPNRKVVGNAKWQKQQSVDVESLSNRAVPYGEASLFFVREVGSAPVQTSINIAINDRFQVSLQPGNFSQVNSCSGLNDISAEITGNKSNDLLYRAQRFDTKSQGTYFFLVQTDGYGNTRVSPMTHHNAISYIKDNNLQYQAHQISRVVKNNCEQPIAPMPIIAEPPPVMPVAKEPVSIELAVFFDIDKSIVKQQYFAEIGRVAEFMNAHPNVTAVIEGHTDSTASDAYNQKLGQRRVDAVKSVLVNEYGIDARRLSAISYGESRPIASNATAEGRRKNRRVVATFSGY